MKLQCTIGLLLALSGGQEWAHAQQRLPRPVLPVQGPVVETKRGGSASKSLPRVIYANTIFSGFYSTPGTGEEWVDKGVIAAALDHDTVTELTLGYATTNPSTDLRFRVYPGYTGFCGFRGPAALDVTLSGLPGSINPGVPVAGFVSVDLNALGECFYLGEGPFGYSFSYSDGVSGPLLSSGGYGQANQFDWTPNSTGICGQYWFGGSPWVGFYAELRAHDGNDTFAGGCGRGVALELEGVTCPGGLLSLTVSGAAPADLWALALGTSIGTGFGGHIGGCPIDVLPIVPILPMGTLGSQPLTIPAVVTLASGATLGIQVITRSPASGLFDSSNTEILLVP
jgi:hypothetical protein